MALTTSGLTNSGVTTHYSFSYDDSFGGPGGIEPARTNAVIAACETDFALMQSWFGSGVNVTGLKVQVATGSANTCGSGGGASGGPGACWNGSATSATVQLIAAGASYVTDSVYLRYLLFSEVTEIFMLAQGKGWFQGSNEGSKGEGLSRFLGSQFLVQNGSLALGIDGDFAVAGLWLNSTRQDFVNNDPDDNGDDATNGCTTLFIYYLFHQLGFTIPQIVAAAGSTLAAVYTNLTGDSGDPFPFFSRLLATAFPPGAPATLPGPNFDDPWPIAILSFTDDKSTFGKDEVTDVLASSSGLFPNAFWLNVEGFNQQVFGGASPSLSGPATTLAGLTFPQDGTFQKWERPSDTRAPQRAQFFFDAQFASSALALFPANGGAPSEQLLNGSITILGSTFSTSTLLEFVAGANPYFTNVDPAQDNVFYLSQDLRLFTGTPADNNTPVAGGPAFADDSLGSAFGYLQNLLAYLNSTFSNPSGSDPFSNSTFPGQGSAFTADTSVTPTTNGHANYNFAIARVRMRGSQGVAGQAQDVRVFFRLWSTQTVDTDFQPGTYPSHLDANGLPDYPLVPAGSNTVPFFATGNSPDLSDPNNPEYGTVGVNRRTLVINTGDTVWAYFGCFLNVYDPANLVNGAPIQTLLNGTHHCIVAEIAYDGAPILNSNGVTESPENSDKLAQRNLQITTSDNPGPAESHIVPQTFDLRPSQPLILGDDPLLAYPDELMIDWGNTPVGAKASIFWPQANASAVLQLAGSLYSSHQLSVADANTVQCLVTGGLTYVPIPPGASENLAGLLTLELPTTVTKGQVFTATIRRISTRRPPPVISIRSKARSAARPAQQAGNQPLNWRYVVGTFAVRIPVGTATTILPVDENTLAIFKWRLEKMSPTNRWYPVLVRYIGYLSGRIRGLGGDPDSIPPSLAGAPRHTEKPCRETCELTGKVVEITYDCFGDFTGFHLADCCTTHHLHSREPGIGHLVLRALRLGLRLVVTVECEHHHAAHGDQHPQEAPQLGSIQNITVLR